MNDMKMIKPKELYQILGIVPAGTYTNGSPNYGSRGTKVLDYAEKKLGAPFTRNSGSSRTGLMVNDEMISKLKEYVDSWDSDSEDQEEAVSTGDVSCISMYAEMIKEQIRCRELLERLCKAWNC